MQTSLFLAKLIGPFLLAIGAGMLANRVGYRAMAQELIRSRVLIYFAGILALLSGLAVVLTHNMWTADWRILITLIGWLAVIGGLFHIVFPEQVTKMGTAMIAKGNIMTIRGSSMLVLGAALSFFGFSA